MTVSGRNKIRFGAGTALLCAAASTAGFFARGTQGAVWAGALACAAVGLAWGFGGDWALSVWQAQRLEEEEAPEVFSIMSRLAEACGQKMPALYLIPSLWPNAMTVNRGPHGAAVAVTAGLVKTLNREELSAVLAYGTAQAENFQASVSSAAAGLAGALAAAVLFLDRIFMFGEGVSTARKRNLLVFAVAAFVIPLAAALIRVFVSAGGVAEADARAAVLCGEPLYLVSALERIPGKDPDCVTEEAGLATAHLFFAGRAARGVFAPLFALHPPPEIRRDAARQAAARSK